MEIGDRQRWKIDKDRRLIEIEDGDRVIVVGQAGLKDQTKVKIVSERKIDFAVNRTRNESYGS